MPELLYSAFIEKLEAPPDLTDDSDRNGRCGTS